MDSHTTDAHLFSNLVGRKSFVAEGKDAVLIDCGLAALVYAFRFSLLDPLALPLLDD